MVRLVRAFGHNIDRDRKSDIASRAESDGDPQLPFPTLLSRFVHELIRPLIPLGCRACSRLVGLE